MPLISSIQNAGAALQSFSRGLDVVQNNLSNASTPGYARQDPVFEEFIYDPSVGLSGTVLMTGSSDRRSDFAEAAVRNRQSALSDATTTASSLTTVEAYFDLEDEGGMHSMLRRLFQQFSEWSKAPNDGVARKLVYEQAKYTALQVRETAAAVNAWAAGLDTRIGNTLGQVNHLAARIAELAEDVRRDGSGAASYYAALEELSGLVDFTTIDRADGSKTILLGGQVPLVDGADAFPLAGGAPVLGSIQGGELGALLRLQNEAYPGIAGDLNRLAQSLAGRVNTDLNLFTYDAAGPAATFRLADGVTEASIPADGAMARRLAGAGSEKLLDGMNFESFFTGISQRIAVLHKDAIDGQDQQRRMLVQAQNARQSLSGVNLDEEAVKLLQLQHSYQAMTRLISTLNELTDSVLALVP